MSLKKRATQCSGYIPASQYVAVYSRPHRSWGWHEELSPITPKPSLDDAYGNRTQRIQEAVKAWLESSPKSVIAPVYRCRSPSTGSPSSCDLSFDRANVILSGSAATSPTDLDDDHIPIISFAIQKRTVQPTIAIGQDHSGETEQNDASPQIACVDSPNRGSLGEGGPRSQIEEGAVVLTSDAGHSSMKKLSITDVKVARLTPESPQRSQVHGMVSLSDAEKQTGCTTVKLDLPGGTGNAGSGTDEAERIVSEAKADTVKDVSVAVSATEVEERSIEGERSNEKDPVCTAAESVKRADVAVPVHGRSASAVSAKKEQTKSSSLPAVVLHGTAAVAGWSEFWTGSDSRRMQPSYNLGSGDSLRHPIVGSSEHQLETSESMEKQSTADQVAAEKATKDEMGTSPMAWEGDRNRKFFYRYEGEERKIHVWEERQIAKASVISNKVEMELEKKSARAIEKRRNEVTKTQKKAEMKATAEARRAEEAAKAPAKARVIGKSPLACFCFSPIVDSPNG